MCECVSVAGIVCDGFYDLSSCWMARKKTPGQGAPPSASATRSRCATLFKLLEDAERKMAVTAAVRQSNRRPVGRSPENYRLTEDRLGQRLVRFKVI